jgi:two-component system cell cycle response regulator
MKSLTTKKVIVRIVIIIAAAEFTVMMILAALPLIVSIYIEAVIDTVLLTVLSVPFIYSWVIKPFVAARDEALDQVSHLAHTDPLTNLPNRRLLSKHFEKFMAGSVRRKVHGAVLFMDLDGFKVLNDEYGHDAGDWVLVEIANRILSITRTEDVAARLGGDEFIILISQLDVDEQTAHSTSLAIAEKLINLVNQPIIFEGIKLQVGASIGIRLLGAEEIDADTAIREADTAMYNAKQAGKGCAKFFEK